MRRAMSRTCGKCSRIRRSLASAVVSGVAGWFLRVLGPNALHRQIVATPVASLTGLPLASLPHLGYSQSDFPSNLPGGTSFEKTCDCICFGVVVVHRVRNGRGVDGIYFRCQVRG